MLSLTNRVYSLRQAADLTGFSQGKFRYNKTVLMNAGVLINEDGWRIPHNALVQLGWFTGGDTNTVIPAPSPLEVAEARVRELEAEVAQLRATASTRLSLFGRRRKG